MTSHPASTGQWPVPAGPNEGLSQVGLIGVFKVPHGPDPCVQGATGAAFPGAEFETYLPVPLLGKLHPLPHSTL